MRKFTDDQGREWKIALSYGVLQKIKEELGIDLLDIRNSAAAQRLQFDLPAFLNLLYFACDAKAQGVDEQSFWDGFRGDVFDAAYSAFQDEYTDFFPKAQRSLMKTALGKTAQTVAMGMQAAQEEIESPETSEALQRKMSDLRTSMRGHIAAALKESPA